MDRPMKPTPFYNVKRTDLIELPMLRRKRDFIADGFIRRIEANLSEYLGCRVSLELNSQEVWPCYADY